MAVYNVYFHPLRKFPGPLFGAATIYYASWYTYWGTILKLEERLHKQYGEVVRIAPNQLSFINETAWKDIFMSRPQMQKHSRFGSAPVDGAYHLINAPDDIHARQRRLMSHAFSEKALREQEPLVQKYVDKLMSNLRKYADDAKEFNIIRCFNYTTFDIVGDLAFAESFGALDNMDETHPWIQAFFDILEPGTKIGELMNIPFVQLIMPLFLISFIKGRNSTFKASEEKINRRMARKVDRPDFMGYVHKYNDDVKGMSPKEIQNTFNVITLAGSETTASLLSGCTYLLQKNPRALEKLKQEIRTSYQSDKEISIPRVNAMPYVNAVIEESLRVYPPAAAGLPRISPPAGATICGHFVTGGTVVSIPPRAAYHNEINFADHKSFIPERWIETDHPRFRSDRHGIFQPFSAGPRNCLGKNLAYSEMKLILARIVYNFDIDLVNKEEDWEDQELYTLYKKPPLMVRVYERKD
ncbi:cytochrome P450 [Aulographum hederae CBS 113979]|uniref:Cytochrome P450 n=1 Tax=Aulographum hederae CBS 113979 TaxID=1176131 RepID=A0A6G1H6J2_9PEZI|nr:cytochrome P450 [Aulographum hederae CBS 113979]